MDVDMQRCRTDDRSSWKWRLVHYAFVWQLLAFFALRTDHWVILLAIAIGMPFLASYYFDGYRIESYKIAALLFFPGTSVMMLLMIALSLVFPV